MNITFIEIKMTESESKTSQEKKKNSEKVGRG